MKPNPIFNLKRFCALIGSGFNIKGNNFIAIMQWIFASTLFLLSLMLIINKLDIELGKLRDVLIRIYQISYALTLAAPSLWGLSRDDEKIKLWNLLPASLFEKTLYYYLRIFILFSILFFAVQFLVDRFIWSAMSNAHTDVSAYYIGLKDIFTLGDTFSNTPGWIRYTAAFFYMALVPLCANGYTGFNKQAALPYTFFLTVVLFIQTPLTAPSQKSMFILQVILISGSVILYMTIFIYAIIKSYRCSK